MPRLSKPLAIIFVITSLCVILLYVRESNSLKLMEQYFNPPQEFTTDLLEEERDLNGNVTTQNPPVKYHNYSQRKTLRDIETLHAKLPPLLPQYKNPCWLELVSKDYNYSNNYLSQRNCMTEDEISQFAYMQDVLRKRCEDEEPCWRMRCFPYFMLLGMQKAGTTTLYTTLTKYHPQILHLARKESQFWARRRHGIDACREGGIKMPFADYLDAHDYPAETIRTTDLGPVHGQIIGDYSPSNAFCQRTWQTWAGNENQNEPRVILPHHIYHMNPHTKFIMSIRDPVARYISNHYFDGKTADMLESSVITAIDKFDKCTEEYPLRNCVYQIADGLCKSMYFVYVKDWMDVFPRKQFYFMLFDDYANDPAKVFMEISDFLELDPLPESAVEELRSMPSRKTTHNTTSTAEKMLQDFYRPWNMKLAAQLQDDRFLWHY